MKIYLVGGAVRDMVLGDSPHDYDYVVFGTTPKEMETNGFIRVGKDFPVFLHPITHDEYALARKEVKTGAKHTDFKFVFGPDITPEEDMQRRDFTCNALMYDKENNQIIDLVGGIDDIKKRIIRHVNTEHFIEDPLRVLRMCRFAAKLDFEIAPETMKLARDMTRTGILSHLTPERIWKEIETALKTEHFDKFIRTMRECGALRVVLPEVNKLWDIPERTDYHPEGNSGEHTMLVLKQGYNLSPKIKFALLLHDIGKIDTPIDILPRHIGHDKAGLQHIEKICDRLKVPNKYRDFALLVAKNHMRFHSVPNMRKGRFISFLEEITDKFRNGKQMIDFMRACKCDSFGRGSSPQFQDQKNEEVFEAARRCLHNYRIQRTVKAIDMPNFESLTKDKTFKDKFLQFRAEKII
ncbi:MAG: HD domain-containing protein [Alphaproteobacteria bacterium]|nr:HD domain-containing protein [Alphaproteobacteria bacterium]